jgi:hypothetical protein
LYTFVLCKRRWPCYTRFFIDIGLLAGYAVINKSNPFTKEFLRRW